MRCRRITDKGNIVWFGVKDVEYYVDENNEQHTRSIFVDNDNKHDNYSTEKEAIKDSLTQRLSVIKNELWYDYQYGLPLTDKVRSKAVVDAYIIKTLLNHPDVLDIEGFESLQDKNTYSCYFIINTIYGQIELGI